MAKDNQRKHAYSPMSNQSANYEPFSQSSVHHGYYGLHCHDFFEFYIFFEGADYFCVDQEVYSLKPNTLIILPPFVMHGLVGSKAPANYRRAWLYVSVPMLQTIGFGMLDLPRYLRDCMLQGKVMMNIGSEAAEECRKMIEAIDEGFSESSAIAQWKNFTLVTSFMRTICAHTEHTATIHAPVIINETMQRIVSYVNGHFTETIQLPDLARQFGVSISYLSHEFIDYTGRSIHNYILYSRVQLAKQRICEGDAFTQIAYFCGFNDYSGFLRAFGKSCGMTPSQYRKHITYLAPPPHADAPSEHENAAPDRESKKAMLLRAYIELIH